MQLFCKVIFDYWRLTEHDRKRCALTPVLSLPSFTGNRNNIEIFLYNLRALFSLIVMVTDVAAKMIGLPPVFWHEHGLGGGVLQVSLLTQHLTVNNITG